jgi:hypothetical protein
MRKFLLVFILLVPWSLKAHKTITFPFEYIDFKIDSQYFSVNGIYTFKNNNNTYTENKIFFPFACNTNLIDSIRVADIENSWKIQFDKKTHGISFFVKINSKSETLINVFYRQKVVQNNVYILTSAKTWGEPLEKAIYTLEAEKHVQIESFSLQPDSMRENSAGTIFYWNKKNYLPQNDFEVRIKE